jgi:hypothetical protein
VPAAFALLLQARFDRAIDARFGAAFAFPARLAGSLALLAFALGATALLPTTSASLLSVGVAWACSTTLPTAPRASSSPSSLRRRAPPTSWAAAPPRSSPWR